MKIIIQDSDVQITLDDRLGRVNMLASRISDDGIAIAPRLEAHFNWGELDTCDRLHVASTQLMQGIAKQLPPAPNPVRRPS